MNRRQKIIVSVTGIFIVLLILIGLTYAYFLTRITGNSNPTSISVTTANLELVYGDGTTALLTSTNPIEPGKFTASKDFTVTNNGNALTDYAVTLEDFAVIYANDTVIDCVSVKAGTVTKMEYPSDMKMTITCVIESDNEDRNGQACGNIDSTLPTENSILLTNSIEVDDIHKYVLNLTYVDSGIDQSADMNKTIKGKIDIIDPKSTIDLTGTVATYQNGDYVEINSTPIKSEIVDGSYKLIGVEPGSHTLYIKYKDASGNVQTRGSETLTIKKGNEASVSGNIITFTDASRIATVDVNSSYEITVDETVKSSLRDAIILNAMNIKNGTELLDAPSTTVGEEVSYTRGSGEIGEIELDMSSQTEWYYASTSADSQPWNGGTEEGFTSICSSTIEKKYISYPEISDSWYVKSCKSETIAIVEGEIMEYESSLLTTQDDLGTSYYYRGNVVDNYVNFAGMCWKIVRVAGDGSTKLILEDQYTTCDDTETEITSAIYTGNWNIGIGNYGYDQDGVIYKSSYLKPVTNNSSSMVKAFYDFQTTKLANYTGKLKSGDWCLGDYNTNSPTLKCNGIILNEFENVENVSSKVPMYVSAITADEVVYAGGTGNFPNPNYYLLNNYQKAASDTFFWLLSHGGSVDNQDYAFSLNSYGVLVESLMDGSDANYGFRPLVSLASGTIIIGGDGTQSNPYVIQ